MGLCVRGGSFETTNQLEVSFRLKVFDAVIAFHLVSLFAHRAPEKSLVVMSIFEHKLEITVTINVAVKLTTVLRLSLHDAELRDRKSTRLNSSHT